VDHVSALILNVRRNVINVKSQYVMIVNVVIKIVRRIVKSVRHVIHVQIVINVITVRSVRIVPIH